MANINVVARAASQAVSSLPKFVIENHDKFVNFLRAYYKWSASEGPDLVMESLKLQNDIDLVIEEMLPGYKASYAKNFPVELKTNFRHFARFLKEFYQLKGTAESYNIFFRAVFNEEVSVYFPKVQIFKPSEAIWNKETYLKVSAVNGNPFDLINREIAGMNNGYIAIVSNVIKVGDYYDVYFEEATGQFEVGETLISDELSVEIVPIYKIKSIVSEPSWLDSSIIYTNDLVLKVDKIYYGKIASLNIVSGGTGYEVDDVIGTSTYFQGTGFKAKVATVDGSGAILTVTIERSGFGFNNEDITVFVESTSGIGADLEPVFDVAFKKIQSLSFIQNAPFVGSVDIVATLTDGTVITFEQGVTNTVKYWITSQSEPSTGHSKIHDSSYYQEFSYELQSRANIRDQEESLKSLLHISGLKMFVKTIIQDAATVESETELLFL